MSSRRTPLPRYLLVVFALLGACDDSTSPGPTPPPPPPPSPPPPPPAPPLTLMLQSVATGLATPILVTAAPNDTRLFVVEKGGRIRIVKNGALLAQPFLDVSALVSNGSEQGLLGLAFHPRYATNGRFVIDYTDQNGDTRIVTYRVSADPDRADAASAQIILTVDQPYDNHNGGHLAFGPDGMLYIGMGDGGSGGDPQGHGQNRNDLLGSLLRLEILDDGQLQIPASNPFVNTAGARGELWDYGLRNPWRFAFDRGTGDLYIADVGQSEREEVNVATAASGGGRGLNYGWSVFEGTRCYAGGSCSGVGMKAPALSYTHSDGCSITGGYVYRGAAIPDLRGTYFYADYCEGWVRSFRFSSGEPTAQTEWATLAPGGTIPSFGEDAAGEIYLCSGSTIYRIVSGS